MDFYLSQRQSTISTSSLDALTQSTSSSSDCINIGELSFGNNLCADCGKDLFECDKQFRKGNSDISKKTRREIYICEKCGRKYCSLGALHRHSTLCEVPSPFSCLICRAKFQLASALIRHLKNVH